MWKKYEKQTSSYNYQGSCQSYLLFKKQTDTDFSPRLIHKSNLNRNYLKLFFVLRVIDIFGCKSLSEKMNQVEPVLLIKRQNVLESRSNGTKSPNNVEICLKILFK